MLKGMMMASAAFPSGALGDLLNKWQEAGFFSYLLPFLLLFALIFGILTKINIFKDNKVVNGIIALAVSLMALQFSFVPDFFAQIFPRMGVGLAIVLGILIVVGLFAPKDSNAVNYVLLGIGVIIIGVIVIQSAGAVGWQSGQWWGENWSIIVGAIVLLVLIAVVIGSASPKDNKGPIPFIGPWAKS